MLFYTNMYFNNKTQTVSFSISSQIVVQHMKFGVYSQYKLMISLNCLLYDLIIFSFSQVTLIPEEAEDMWHTYNLLQVGDSLRASTIR